MPSSRSRSRSKKRRRRLDSELSFIDILGKDPNENPDNDEITKELAESFDVSENSIPGQDEFMKKQSEIDKKKE